MTKATSGKEMRDRVLEASKIIKPSNNSVTHTTLIKSASYKGKTND